MIGVDNNSIKQCSHDDGQVPLITDLVIVEDTQFHNICCMMVFIRTTLIIMYLSFSNLAGNIDMSDLQPTELKQTIGLVQQRYFL